MRCFVAAIEHGETVCKKTLAVGKALIIGMCKHLMSLNIPEAYESQAVLSILRQAVGRVGKVGSSIWKTCFFNHDTEQWELEWPEEKT
eukprot:13619113-Ditylum_brightwellii.AAC.1